MCLRGSRALRCELKTKAKTQDKSKRCSHHGALRYTEVKLEEEIMAFDVLRGPLCSQW